MNVFHAKTPIFVLPNQNPGHQLGASKIVKKEKRSNYYLQQKVRSFPSIRHLRNIKKSSRHSRICTGKEQWPSVLQANREAKSVGITDAI